MHRRPQQSGGIVDDRSVSAMGSATPLIDTDEALIARAKYDRDAFGCLYDRYVEQVYRFIYRRVKDHTAAEDITARVFFRALEQLPRFEWRGVPFGGWLIRIAVNLIHDHHSEAQRHVSLAELTEDGITLAASDPPLEEQYAARQTASVLWQTVSSLSMAEQQVLVYRFARDMSVRDIATTMRRTEGAVKQLLFRAVKRLRQRLPRRGWVDEA
jgi:RNA polymerase sigma-70 factor (ECF subfamily)